MGRTRMRMIREWEKTEALMTEDLPENRSTVPGSTSTVGQAVFSHAKPSSEGNPVSRHVQLKLDGDLPTRVRSPAEHTREYCIVAHDDHGGGRTPKETLPRIHSDHLRTDSLWRT